MSGILDVVRRAQKELQDKADAERNHRPGFSVLNALRLHEEPRKRVEDAKRRQAEGNKWGQR